MTLRTGLAGAVMVASATACTLALPKALALLVALLPLVPDALARVLGS